MRRIRAADVLLCLVLIHVVWGLLRIPGRVIARRCDDVRAYQQRGAPAFLLGQEGVGGAVAIEWLLAHTPPECAVLWEGRHNGPLEFAPGLLAPRLLVAVGHCPVDAVEYAGVPVARAELGGRRGTVVLVASADNLRVEVR